MLGSVLEIVGMGALLLGLSLATIAIYGLLRMPNVFHQLHAAGLLSGPAVILVLLASIGTGHVAIITSATLIALFVMVTAPLSGHAIAEAALHRTRSDDAGLTPAPPLATPEMDAKRDR